MNQQLRRHFLRGAGVALALPWMESLPLRAATTDANQPPLRFACIYWSNGIKPAHWWAKGSGAAMEFGQSAAPLKPYAQDLVFIKGLFNEQAFKNPSPHQGRNANLLSGETHVNVVITRYAGSAQEVTERHTVILKKADEAVEVTQVKFR